MKSFVNGRALGCHMRSHKFNIDEDEEQELTSQLSYKTESDIATSSSSDTTTEEDLAFCLMMLSRDKWNKEEIDTEESSKIMNRNTRYNKCETCGKVFRSYQALGGHRASHKRIKIETEHDNVVTVSVTEKRIYECVICLRVFASGQALGGHKRSHGISANHRMIDLNLPATTKEEEEDVSLVFH